MAVKEIKEKSIYVCTGCGYESAKWQGRCPDCGNWNTLVEETRIIGKEKKGQTAIQREPSPVMALDTVNADESVRYHTGMEELDRVLGGGIVPGAAIRGSVNPQYCCRCAGRWRMICGSCMFPGRKAPGR